MVTAGMILVRYKDILPDSNRMIYNVVRFSINNRYSSVIGYISIKRFNPPFSRQLTDSKRYIYYWTPGGKGV